MSTETEAFTADDYAPAANTQPEIKNDQQEQEAPQAEPALDAGSAQEETQEQEQAEQAEPEQEGQEPKLSEAEQKAIRMGWSPKEKFRGDESKWVPADEYIKRAEESLPMLKENLSRMDDKYKKLEDSFKKLAEHHQKVEKRTREKILEEIRKEQREAVAEGDVERFEALEKKRADAEKQQEDLDLDITKQPDPIQTQKAVIESWVSENDWYNKDQELAIAAQAYEAALARTNPNLSLNDRLAKTSQHIKKIFPEKFPNLNQARAPKFAPTYRTATPPKREKGFNDLPADAKAIFQQWTRSGVKLDPERYAKDYFEVN